MKKLKIMTVVGTRPEVIRLSRVIARLNSLSSVEHTLVHTGQNYDVELNDIFFDEFGIDQPNFYLDAARESAISTIAACLEKIEPVLDQVAPDAFLVLGDTNSCLCAIAAKKKKIPVFHMEAGNRCFDMRVPEELNRKIVDHIADINLTYSEISRDYLISEGVKPDTVIKVGSPMLEVLDKSKQSIAESNVLDRLGLEAKGYFVVSAHREENIEPDRSFHALVDILNALAEKEGLPIVVSTHPRTRKRVEAVGIQFHENIRLMKPLGYADYIALQVNSRAVLSDSGTISEEASLLGLRAMNIRETHERPEAMVEGAALMVGLDIDRVFQALELLDASEPNDLRRVEDYNVPNVSEKVARIILSYVNYVNSNNYRKSSV